MILINIQIIFNFANISINNKISADLLYDYNVLGYTKQYFIIKIKKY